MNRQRKLAILVLATTFPRWHGDSTPPFVWHFCKRLAAHFARVFVLAPHAKGALQNDRKDNVVIKRFRYFIPASQQTLAYDGAAVTKINKSPLYAFKLVCFMISLGFNTFMICIFKRIDIINAHWLIPKGFAAVLVKLLTGRKVVVTVHGGDIFSLRGKLFTKIKRFVLKHADAVVVNSSATLQACQKVYSGANYAVIPMGVDTDHFKPRSTPKDIVNRYGLDGFTILFVGRLSSEKGVIYLCQALKKLKASRKSFKAIIIGDGSEAPVLHKYVQDNDLDSHVMFTGWVDAKDIVGFYNTADVFVGPSIHATTGWQEALGLVFAEALACGVPVIATRTGGIADVVDDGKTGFLVPQKSADAIHDKLSVLYEDAKLRQGMSRHARHKIVTNYSWQSVIERYEQLFRHVHQG